MSLDRILVLISIYNLVNLKLMPPFTIPHVKFRGFHLKPQQRRQPYYCPLINNKHFMETQYVNTFIICPRTKNHLPSCHVALFIAIILKATENFCTAAEVIALTTIQVFRDATALSVGK
jgi:hypothetical protein